jgi:hypothetical protein
MWPQGTIISRRFSILGVKDSWLVVMFWVNPASLRIFLVLGTMGLRLSPFIGWKLICRREEGSGFRFEARVPLAYLARRVGGHFFIRQGDVRVGHDRRHHVRLARQEAFLINGLFHELGPALGQHLRVPRNNRPLLLRLLLEVAFRVGRLAVHRHLRRSAGHSSKRFVTFNPVDRGVDSGYADLPRGRAR